MHVKIIALTLAAAIGLLALGCTETTVVREDRETSGITVSGSGSAFGQPDVALITLGVQAEADSVGEARSQAAGAMDAMLTALKDGGVAEDDIQTTRFSVYPVYDYTDNRQELRGFVVDNTVTAKIRTIDDTGDLIDAAVEAGGDLARVDNLQFTIDDPSALEDEARRAAMAEAKQKAETLADEAGVDLGAPRSISESGGPVPVPFAGAELALTQDAARTPIEVGELEVVVSVQVVYGVD